MIDLRLAYISFVRAYLKQLLSSFVVLLTEVLFRMRSQSQIEMKSSYSQSTQASLKSTGRQPQIETKSTSSQSQQIRDMIVSDNMSQVKQDIESVENI